ncbi:MAG TPA: efflux RND transporter periplasmic adaptor subunit, partial [Candidatus Competibacteraceae bacterium]|nr:efflux RND transporter periplasmic adaptor subunit [Candidatus Competibacteraceae bacterium]
PVVRELVLQGQVEPNRRVILKAETDGAVAELLAERGQRLAAGAPVLRLAMNDRAARLAKAEAALHQREQDYAALARLGRSGFQSETQLNQAQADLAEARAELERIRLDIARTTIQAPFAGILNERPVELGQVVAVGDAVATLVDNDPLLAVAQVPQQMMSKLRLGGTGAVRFATGHNTAGRIRYLSANADAATRTFRVELEVPNPDGQLPAGTSAELRIPLETVATHFLSPSLLSLDSSGVLGVKTVEHDDTVAFHPVQIVRSSADGVWVSGLPAQARLITLGQGFVEPGERVRVIESAVAAHQPARAPAPVQ